MAYRVPLPLSHFRIYTPYSKDFLDGPNHYTSPNQDVLPSHIPIPLAAHNPSPADLRNQIWADDNRPYLAFIYQSPLFGGAMNRFASFGRQTIQQGSSSWHLPHEMAKSWKNFEHGLRSTAQKLTSYFTQTYPHMPCSWTVPEKPSLYGYFEGHGTAEAAYEAVQLSIDGFVIFSAYVAFLARLCQTCDQDWLPPSLESLFRSAHIPVHPHWIENLLTSGMGESNVQRRRLGVIVDPRTCQWLNLTPYMIKADIPIWFYWGSKPFYDCPDSWLSSYRPNLFFLRTLQPDVSMSSTLAPVPEGFPQVEINSGQRPGELMEDFFKRRQEQNRVREKRENTKDRQSRLSRKQSAASKSCPGRKGPRVYRWEKIDGHRIRTEVTRQQVEGWWSYYQPKQIRYDDFLNQFDCCSDFDDGSSGHRYDSDDDSDQESRGPLIAVSQPLHTTVTVLDQSQGLSTAVSQSSPVSLTLYDHFQGPSTAVSQSLVTSSATTLSPPPVLGQCRGPSSALFQFLPTSSATTTSDQSQAPSTVVSQSPLLSSTAHDQFHSPSTALSQSLPTSSAITLLPPPLNAPTSVPMSPRNNLRSDVCDPVPTPAPEVLPSVEGLRPPQTEEQSVDQIDNIDLLQVSKQDILHLNPISEVQEGPPELQSIEDVLFHRYGYSIDEIPYQGLPRILTDVKRTFNSFSTLCCAVGGQHVSTVTQQEPITDFIDILIASTQPFHDMPSKYWDLSPANSAALARIELVHFHIELKRFPDQILCLLHPQGLHSDDHPSWLLAVSPQTALECLRRGLGPHPVDIAEYLVIEGMEFRTLQRLASLPAHQPLSSSSSTAKPLSGSRPARYTFDEADFGSYETFRDSYLRATPSARRALSVGGIVARLAREILPASVIKSGPSPDALRGSQDVLICNGEIFVDDALSPEVMELICGTYRQNTGSGSQLALVSWFPQHNVWSHSGYNVGHWNQECEDWYLRRRANILDNVQRAPLPSTKWRDKLRMTRAAAKISYQINQAALHYLQSTLAHPLIHSPCSTSTCI